MMLSQNGYTGVETYGDPLLISNPTIPGTSIKVLGGLRKGPVAEILLYTLGRINREVRAFRSQEQGFWGYNYRPIRGATQLSNHASGTAADFLAADLPLGVEPDRVMTKTEIAALRSIAADLDGLVRFGAFYTGRKDPMHIEVVADEHELAAYMDSLTAKTPAPKAIKEPELIFMVIITAPGRDNALLSGNVFVGIDADEFAGFTAAGIKVVKVRPELWDQFAKWANR